MPRSVSTAARRNCDTVRAAARRLVGQDQTGRLERFHALVSTSSFSSNVSADKVTIFDEVGTVLDSRALKQHGEGGDRRAGLKHFGPNRQPGPVPGALRGDVAARARVRVRGRQRGRNGDRGSVRAVLSRDGRPAGGALAVFPGNSAERYCSPTGVVDGARAAREVVGWDERADGAVRERGAEALGVPDHEWPGLVCRPGRFLEVVIGPPPPLSTITAVRMRADYQERLADLEGRALEGTVLQGAERYEVAAFKALSRWRRAYGIALEGVG